MILIILLTVVGNLPNLSWKLPRLDLVNDIVGALLGDHVGVRFLASQPFELYVDTTDVSDLIWEIVASDVVAGKVRVQNEWKRICPERSDAGFHSGQFFHFCARLLNCVK